MSSVQQNVIKHKFGLLNLAAKLGNVSRACKMVGFSRDIFCRYQSAMEEGDVEALLDANRRKPNIKNRVEEATEVAVTSFSLEQPAFGQARVSNGNPPVIPPFLMGIESRAQAPMPNFILGVIPPMAM